MTKRPRIGVVGTGWWASNHHIPALAEYDGAELVALCDPVRSRAEELAARHAVAMVATDVEELLGANLDGVVIATPHATHHALARAALDAGLHVLVEKTMTTTAADAFDLVTAAEKAGLHLSVGYTYQYAATADFAREAVHERIGDLVQVIAEFTSGTAGLFAAAEAAEETAAEAAEETAAEAAEEGDDAADQHPATYSARLGGGQAHTQVTHVMGMVCWATGREIAEVSAFTDHRGLEVDVDDVAAFRFTGGGTGVLASTGCGLGPGLRHGVRYIGTKGIVDQDMLAARVAVYGTEEAFIDRTPPHDVPAYSTRQPARSFADLIAGRGPNRAPGREAAATVAFIEALLESAATRRIATVAQLPPQ